MDWVSQKRNFQGYLIKALPGEMAGCAPALRVWGFICANNFAQSLGLG